jgi:hypothetical protein
MKKLKIDVLKRGGYVECKDQKQVSKLIELAGKAGYKKSISLESQDRFNEPRGLSFTIITSGYACFHGSSRRNKYQYSDFK